MKLQSILQIAIFASVVVPPSLSLSAPQGPGSTGGGDAACEARFKAVRDDMSDWIASGGGQKLQLGNVTVSEYQQKMLSEVGSASIECLPDSDPRMPLTVAGVAKVCLFEKQSSGNKILCGYRNFQALDESNQYVLVHHEYAGLAGLERPDGGSSVYQISNQLRSYLVSRTEKRLSLNSKALCPTVPAGDAANAFGPISGCGGNWAVTAAGPDLYRIDIMLSAFKKVGTTIAQKPLELVCHDNNWAFATSGNKLYQYTGLGDANHPAESFAVVGQADEGTRIFSLKCSGNYVFVETQNARFQYIGAGPGAGFHRLP